MSLKKTFLGAVCVMTLGLGVASAEAQVVAPGIAAPLGAAPLTVSALSAIPLGIAPLTASAAIAGPVGGIAPLPAMTPFVSPFIPLVATAYDPIIATLGLSPYVGTLDDVTIASSMLAVNTALALQVQAAIPLATTPLVANWANNTWWMNNAFSTQFPIMLGAWGLTPLTNAYTTQLGVVFPGALGTFPGAFDAAFMSSWLLYANNWLAVIDGMLIPGVVSPGLNAMRVGLRANTAAQIAAAQALVPLL